MTESIGPPKQAAAAELFHRLYIEEDGWYLIDADRSVEEVQVCTPRLTYLPTAFGRFNSGLEPILHRGAQWAQSDTDRSVTGVQRGPECPFSQLQKNSSGPKTEHFIEADR